MAGALTALLILLVVGVAVMYAQKKKKGKAPAGTKLDLSFLVFCAVPRD